MNVSRRHFLIYANSVVLSAPAFAGTADTSAMVVDTPFGPVKGDTDGAVIRFLGIPYGKAPGRFERAEPVFWKEKLEANAFGPVSPQLRNRADAVMDEDCQVLNIWAPRATGRARPVMVWLHGGGFQAGSANSERFDGAALAQQYDVVVVTLNHRLGVCGALRIDHLDSDYSDSGCVGMLDIVDALHWVNKSIAAFGGDPACLTIFGQSGGGGKVMTLLAMPEACGLFHRAIIQSGSMQKTAATPEQGEEATGQLLKALSIDNNPVAKLKAAPLEQLLEAQAVLQEDRTPGIRPFSPIIDGENLPEQPFGSHAPECSRLVPVMIGSTTEELRPFNMSKPELFSLDADGLKAALQEILGEKTDSAIAAYRAARPDASPSDLYFAITADDMYWSNSVAVAQLKAAQGGAPVFMYRYAYDPDRATRGAEPTVGAGHGQEIKYAFAHIPPDAQTEQRLLESEISGAWTKFARNGDPNGRQLARWSAYDAHRRMTMVYDAPSAQASDPYRLEREWWAKNR